MRPNGDGKIVLMALTLALLSGCASTSQTINAYNGSTVNCSSRVDRPVDIGTSLQGNVPTGGGTVTTPTMTTTTTK